MARNVVNIHLCKGNAGDRAAGPGAYFGWYRMDIYGHYNWDEHADVVIGGGGLLYPGFDGHISRLLATPRRKLVVWGVGANDHGMANWRGREWFKQCDLVGIRDWGTCWTWVPCASCLMPDFDVAPTQPAHEVGIVRHATVPWTQQETETLPSISNAASAQDIIAFIKTCETIVTNTYHAAYWATLLGRRVIVAGFSSRFFHFKHPPVMLVEQGNWREALRFTAAYPEALEECRSANLAFKIKMSDICER